MDFNVGDIVKTRKKHPCGNDKWEILGIGVQFRLKCKECGHVLVVDREKAKRMITKKL